MANRPSVKRKCEICGKTATHQVRDTLVREKGSTIAKLSPMGKVHYYCDECYRPSETYYADR